MSSSASASSHEPPAKRRRTSQTTNKLLCFAKCEDFYVATPMPVSLVFVHGEFAYAIEKDTIYKLIISSLQERIGVYQSSLNLVPITLMKIPNDTSSILHVYCKGIGKLYQFYPGKTQIGRVVFHTGKPPTYTIINPTKQQILTKKDGQFAAFDSSTKKIVIHGEDEYSVFNTETNSWEILNKKCSLIRSHHSVAVHPNSSNMYVFGGTNKGSATNSTWRYNIKKDEWADISSQTKVAPMPRENGAFDVSLDAEFALLYGGNNGIVEYNDLWMFHFETEQWHRMTFINFMPLQSKPLMSENCFILGPKEKCTHGALLKLQKRLTSASLNLESLSQTLERLLKDKSLADTSIKLKDGSTLAHKFVLSGFPIGGMIKPAAAGSTTTITGQIDLSELDIRLKTFRKYILPLLYNQATNPRNGHLIDALEVADILLLPAHKEWLTKQLDSVLAEKSVESAELIATFARHKSAGKYMDKLVNAAALLSEQHRVKLVSLLEAQPPPMEVMFQIMRAFASKSAKPIQVDRSTPPPQSTFQHEYDVFLCDKEKTITMGAHKAYLVACSDYFKPFFSGQFQEATTLQEGDNSIVLNCGPVALRTLVEMLYGQTVNFEHVDEETLDDLLDLLRLCDELLMREAIEQLASPIFQVLSGDYFLEFLKITKHPEAAVDVGFSFTAAELLLSEVDPTTKH